MISLADVLAAICKRYPWGISRSRLLKTAYLVDWESVRVHGHQVSDAAWYWGDAGPTTANVDEILQKPPFSIVSGETAGGASFELVTIPRMHRSRLPREAADLIERVLAQYGVMHTRDFLQAVYSTYPLLASRPGDRLNLSELGRIGRKKAVV